MFLGTVLLDRDRALPRTPKSRDIELKVYASAMAVIQCVCIISFKAAKLCVVFNSVLYAIQNFQVQNTLYKIHFKKYILQNTHFNKKTLQNTLYRIHFREYTLQDTLYLVDPGKVLG